MRVLLCGGGTAGHVNPAIAIGETILRNSSNSKIAYVTTLNGIENSLVEFKKYPIDVSGFKGVFSFQNIKSVFKQFKAIERCKEIIREFRPDIIFGTGGYATYPVVVAGHRLGVKTVLHESNVVPGRAVMKLEKIADRILVNFEESKKFFKNKEKVIRTGNPLRRGCDSYDKAQSRKELGITQKYVILCTGGSLGAERINQSAIEIIDNLVRCNSEVLFIWSTGKREWEASLGLSADRGLNKLNNVWMSDYFSNLPMLMSAADIVISRAGAMTLSELASLKKASILVPSPNVANDHQRKNAEAIERAGGAIMILESKLYEIVDVVKELLDSPERQLDLEKNIARFSMPNANRTIYNVLYNLL